MKLRTKDILKRNERLHPDAQLIKSCIAGDIGSQRALYDQYKRPLFRLCLRYASNRQDAEDYLQEGFIVIYRDLKQFRMEGPLGAWMRRVMVNSVLQQLRKKRHLFTDTEIDVVSHRMPVEEAATGALDAEFLTTVIQRLPDGYRTVFNMYVIEGYSHKEIATELGITTGTSKSQLSKARAMLRDQLAGTVTTQHV